MVCQLGRPSRICHLCFYGAPWWHVTILTWTFCSWGFKGCLTHGFWVSVKAKTCLCLKIFIIFGINHHIYSSSPPGLTASWYLDCLPCNQWLFRGTKPRVHTRANPFCRWPERGQILWSGGEGRLSNGCGWGFSQRETKQWTVLDGGLWCFACIRQERCELVRACAFSCFFGGLSAFLFAKWQTHSRQTRLGSSSNDQHLEDSCAHGRTALKKRWNWWNVWRSTVQSDLAALVLMVLSTFVIPFFPIPKFDCHNCSQGILCFLESQIGDLQN